MAGPAKDGTGGAGRALDAPPADARAPAPKPTAKAPARDALPVMLLANDLLTGEVVVWDGAGFAPDPARALVARDPAGADALEARARDGEARRLVVDAAVVGVVEGSAPPRPRHFRERFKIAGPSHRPDLGKQARYGGLRAPHPHPEG